MNHPVLIAAGRTQASKDELQFIVTNLIGTYYPVEAVLTAEKQGKMHSTSAKTQKHPSSSPSSRKKTSSPCTSKSSLNTSSS